MPWDRGYEVFRLGLLSLKSHPSLRLITATSVLAHRCLPRAFLIYPVLSCVHIQLTWMEHRVFLGSVGSHREMAPHSYTRFSRVPSCYVTAIPTHLVLELGQRHVTCVGKPYRPLPHPRASPPSQLIVQCCVSSRDGATYNCYVTAIFIAARSLLVTQQMAPEALSVCVYVANSTVPPPRGFVPENQRCTVSPNRVGERPGVKCYWLAEASPCKSWVVLTGDSNPDCARARRAL